MRSAALVLCLAVFSVPALASTGIDENYYTIGSVNVSEIQENQLFESELFQVPSPSDLKDFGPLLSKAVSASQIVNIGLKLWELVVQNQPVIQFESTTANALPAGAQSWRQLQGWQTPRSKLFRIDYRNLYGMDVVDFTFRVLYTYGGNINGTGRYLTNVTMIPADLDVAWGYKFDAKATVADVTNAGTKKNPIAAMQLVMGWSVDTILRKSRGSSVFYIKGDGQFQDLSAGN